MNTEFGDVRKKAGEMTKVPLLTGCCVLFGKVTRWVEW